MSTSLGTIVVHLVGDARQYQQMLDQARRDTDNATAAVEASARQVEQFGTNLVTFAGDVVAALQAMDSTKEFSKFNKGMVEATSIMQELTQDQIKAMEEVAKQLSLEYAKSPEELAKAFYFLASAGLSAEQAIASLPIVTKFAIAGVFDLQKATTLALGVQGAMGMQSEDTATHLRNLTDVTDQVVKASKIARTNTENLALSLSNFGGPALRIYNKGLAEGLSILAIWAKQNIVGRKAGTDLDRVLRLLAKSAITQGKVQENLGLNVFDANGQMYNMVGITGDLGNMFAKMSPEVRAGTMQQMGFASHIRQSILPLIGYSDKMQEIQDMLGPHALGTSHKIAGNQMEAFANQMTILGNTFKVVRIEMGEMIAPTILTLAAAVRGLLLRWRSLDDDTKRFLLTAGTMFLLLVNLKYILRATALVLSTMFSPFLWLVVGASVAMAAALRHGTDILVKMRDAIYSISADLDLSGIMTNTIKAFHEGTSIFESFAGAARVLGEGIITIWEKISTAIIDALGPVGQAIQGVAQWFLSLFGWVKPVYDFMARLIGEVFAALPDIMAPVVIVGMALTMVFKTLYEAAVLLWDGVKDLWDLLGRLWQLAKTVWAGFISLVSVFEFAWEAIKSLVDVFAPLWRIINDVAIAVGTFLNNHLSINISLTWDAVKAVVGLMLAGYGLYKLFQLMSVSIVAINVALRITGIQALTVNLAWITWQFTIQSTYGLLLLVRVQMAAWVVVLGSIYTMMVLVQGATSVYNATQVTYQALLITTRSATIAYYGALTATAVAIGIVTTVWAVMMATMAALSVLQSALTTRAFWYRAAMVAVYTILIPFNLAIYAGIAIYRAIITVWTIMRAAGVALATIWQLLRSTSLLTIATWALMIPAILTYNAAIGLARLATLSWQGAMSLVRAAITGMTASVSALNVILGVSGFLAVVGSVLALYSAFRLVWGAIQGVYNAGKSVLEIVAKLFTTTGPIAALTGIFKELWDNIKLVVRAMKLDMDLAMKIAGVAVKLFIAQVTAIFPPFWKFLKDGFIALWELVVDSFRIDMQLAIEDIKKRIKVVILGEIMWESTGREKRYQKYISDMEKLRASLRSLAELRLQKASGAFSYTETDQIRQYRAEIKDLTKDLNQLEKDDADRKRKERQGGLWMDFQSWVQNWTEMGIKEIKSLFGTMAEDILGSQGAAQLMADMEELGEMAGGKFTKGVKTKMDKMDAVLINSAEAFRRYQKYIDIINVGEPKRLQDIREGVSTFDPEMPARQARRAPQDWEWLRYKDPNTKILGDIRDLLRKDLEKKGDPTFELDLADFDE